MNWILYFGIGIGLFFIFPGITSWCYAALMIAIFQFMLVFFSIGYVIPIRYIAGSLMSLQMLVGPSFAYSGLDLYQLVRYRMKIPEAEYFTYAIPAVLMFILGLHVFSRLRGEIIEVNRVREYVNQKPNMMYFFIVLGFVMSISSNFVSSELGFIFYLFGGFKFIGAFLLIIGERRLKPGPLILVFGSIILSSLGAAMFHDLVTWFIFLLAVLAIKYRPAMPVKVAFTIGFILAVVVLQQLKGIYRTATLKQGKERGLAAFDDAYEQAQVGESFFSVPRLARSNVRINQGFILTNVMNNVPARVSHENGAELYKIVEAAVMPRILAPNKLIAGDREGFRKYTGMPLRGDTSMSLGSLADGYINFGIAGGCIFMFALGAVFNFVLIKFHKIGKLYPVALLFTPLVFYYPIRPDTALQTSLGHLVKCCFLLYVVFICWKSEWKLKKIIKPSSA